MWVVVYVLKHGRRTKSSGSTADMPTARGKCRNVRAHGAITRYHLDCLPAGCSSFMASSGHALSVSVGRLAHLGMHD